MNLTFAEKMNNAMQQIGTVAKDAENSFHSYTYASHTAIKAACNKAMRDNGLYIKQVSFSESHEGNKTYTRCTITVTDGEVRDASADGLGCGVDKGDKGPMKAATAAYKYALCHLFCIPVADGTDPEADSDEMAQEYFMRVVSEIHSRLSGKNVTRKQVIDSLRSNWNLVPSEEAINTAARLTLKDFE